MAAKGGTSAMLEVLATRVEGMESMLSEVRQDVKEIRDKVIRLETEVGGLKAKRNGDWVRYVWNFVSVLIGALLALVGVRMQSGG